MIPGYLAGALRDKPAIPGYRWRTRTYPAAVRAIQRAEAVHGPPVPTCLACGGQVVFSRQRPAYGQCASCGRDARTPTFPPPWGCGPRPARTPRR